MLTRFSAKRNEITLTVVKNSYFRYANFLLYCKILHGESKKRSLFYLRNAAVNKVKFFLSFSLLFFSFRFLSFPFLSFLFYIRFPPYSLYFIHKIFFHREGGIGKLQAQLKNAGYRLQQVGAGITLLSFPFLCYSSLFFSFGETKFNMLSAPTCCNRYPSFIIDLLTSQYLLSMEEYLVDIESLSFCTLPQLCPKSRCCPCLQLGYHDYIEWCRGKEFCSRT